MQIKSEEEKITFTLTLFIFKLCVCFARMADTDWPITSVAVVTDLTKVPPGFIVVMYILQEEQVDVCHILRCWNQKF